MSNIWKLARRENHVCAVGSVAGKIAPLSHGSASRVDADGVSLWRLTRSSRFCIGGCGLHSGIRWPA